MTDITNYVTFKTELTALSKRTDVSTRLAAMTSRAESMIYKKLRCLENMRITTLGVADAIATGVYKLPVDSLDVRDCWLSGGDGRILKKRTLAELRNFVTTGPTHSFAVRPGAGTSTTNPAVIELAGAPDSATAIVYTHDFFRPASFNADADTNLVLTTHPELYLFAAQYWLAIDAKDYDEASDLKTLFDLQVADVNRQADKLRRSGASPNLVTINHGSSM